MFYRGQRRPHKAFPMIPRPSPAQTVVTDLTPLWDTDRVLRNPHKGWYQHYFDNSLTQYLPRLDADMDDFPGMSHVYLRFAWSYLEPEQGKFRWNLIDDVAKKWTTKGYTVSIGITCKETDIYHATPEWVKSAGARGLEQKTPWDTKHWQPDYGDPLFLRHLGAMLRALGKRYANKPWLEYVDVRSYGDWGEGHNSFSGRGTWGFDVLKQHIDLHRAAFSRNRLYVSDDFVTTGTHEADRKRMEDYIITQGLSFRDDSILVDYYTRTAEPAKRNFSVSAPGLFERTWRDRPVLLETQHYPMMKTTDKTWTTPNGVPVGAATLEGAIRLMHASFIGFHGDPGEYLAENPVVARRMANLAGYWFFPVTVATPGVVSHRDKAVPITVIWRNRGVAPAYHPYRVLVKLTGAGGETIHTARPTEAASDKWMPDANEKSQGAQDVTETYGVPLPALLKPGVYSVCVALRDGSRPVEIGLSVKYCDRDGFYALTTVSVE